MGIWFRALTQGSPSRKQLYPKRALQARFDIFSGYCFLPGMGLQSPERGRLKDWRVLKHPRLQDAPRTIEAVHSEATNPNVDP